MTRAGPGANRRWTSVGRCVVDLEVVELARRTVAPELPRIDVVYTGPRKQVGQLGAVLVAKLLLDAVRAKAGDLAAHVEAGLVDRVAQCLTRIAADDEAAGLRHEGAQVTDGAPDDDVDSFHRDPAARRRVAVHDQQPAVAACAGRLARAPVDDNGSGHQVLGHSGTRVPVNAHRRELVHAGAVVADMALNLHVDLRVETAGDRMGSVRVEDAPAPHAARELVQPPVALPQAIVVRERAVVYQAQVEPRRERMRPLGRHPALRRHPGVAEAVAAFDVAEPELLDECLRTTDLLVDLDHASRAHHPQVGAVPSDPVLHLACFRLDDDHGVIGPDTSLMGAAERRGKLATESFPRHLGIERVERQLARAARHRVPVDGDAGAVRPALAHLLEHGGEVVPESRLELGRLAEESDDSTHMVTSYTRSIALLPNSRLSASTSSPLFLRAVWRFPPYSEARQVLLDLPRRHLLVVTAPLVPLHPDEVVHVVLVPGLAERLADHVVALELVRRVQEVGGQCLEPPRTQLRSRSTPA